MPDYKLKKIVEKNIDKIEPDLIFLQSDYKMYDNRSSSITGELKLDMLAIDKNSNPVIIELKSLNDSGLSSVLEQVGEYLYIFHDAADEDYFELCKAKGISTEKYILDDNIENTRILILSEKKDSASFIQLKNAVEAYAMNIDIRLYSYKLSADKTSIEDIRLESPHKISFSKKIFFKDEEQEKLYKELGDLFYEMSQLSTREKGRGKLGLTIGNKLNLYKDITKKTDKQLGAEFRRSFRTISNYIRTKKLIPEIKEEIKRDVLSYSRASRLISKLNDSQQRKVHEFIAIFKSRNTKIRTLDEEKVKRIVAAALKNEKYDDIKSDLLAK